MIKTGFDIRPLDPCDPDTAEKMQAVFQRSYQVEAALISADNFPPLDRSNKDRADAGTKFIGAWKRETLTAVLEFLCDRDELNIHSLVVDPAYFRQGLASGLIHHLMDSQPWTTALVETAIANTPAINLYECLGFSRDHTWTTEVGIRKIRFSLCRRNP
ncbi:MAG: hypothetical protein DHS20C11_04430 [Lysobacteraceae bacterium]|nr:MAG: hypothetical protein DHS20C11_04430 [Xanthomonadaceae bacterium]